MAIATDLEENPGRSTVNAVEALAAALREHVFVSGEFELILHHPGSPAPFCFVTFAGPGFHDPQWHELDGREVLKRLRITALPSVELTADEERRLQKIREEVDKARRQLAAHERASMQVVALSDLPVAQEVLSPRYLEANWPRIAKAACAILRSGVDPLDRVAVQAEAERLMHSASDLRWLVSLFVDPIVVSLDAGAYTNGRHRTEAMRRSGVRVCVAHVEPGYELPAAFELHN